MRMKKRIVRITVNVGGTAGVELLSLYNAETGVFFMRCEKFEEVVFNDR